MIGPAWGSCPREKQDQAWVPPAHWQRWDVWEQIDSFLGKVIFELIESVWKSVLSGDIPALSLHSPLLVCFENFWKTHLDFLFQHKINFEICWGCVYILVFKRGLFREWKISKGWSETWVWEFWNKKFYLTKTKKTKKEKWKYTQGNLKQYFSLLLTMTLKKSTICPPWDEMLYIFVKLFLQLQFQICSLKNISEDPFMSYYDKASKHFTMFSSECAHREALIALFFSTGKWWETDLSHIILVIEKWNVLSKLLV